MTTNAQALKLRQGFRALYGSVSDDRLLEQLDHLRYETERKLGIELYLEDLHEDLDPPDDAIEIRPFDASLREWIEANDHTICDWFDNGWLRNASFDALSCVFDMYGRRMP